MNIIAQEAKKRQAVVKLANRKRKKLCKPKIWNKACRKRKTMVQRYDGTWQSLAEKSHRPHSHQNAIQQAKNS